MFGIILKMLKTQLFQLVPLLLAMDFPKIYTLVAYSPAGTTLDNIQAEPQGSYNNVRC